MDTEIREEVTKIFKTEMKEELIPLIMTTIDDQVESRIHDIINRNDEKWANILANRKAKDHRVAKILMEN
jgi:hypothetical protein